MPFSEAVRLEVKQKADFRCCICHNYFVEVHHIIPEASGGPNATDNAAPLCPTCHDRYGDNPVKRKAIREMRDHWYERCRTVAEHPDVVQFSRKLDDLYTRVSDVKGDTGEHSRILGEMKDTVAGYFRQQADQVTEVSTVSQLIQVTGGTMASGAEVYLTDGTSTYRGCPGCGVLVPLYGVQKCPYCGTDLE